MAEPASNNVFDELAGAKASGNKEYSDYLQSAIDYSDKTYGGDFTKTAMGGEPSAAQAPAEEMPYAEDLFSSVKQANPEQPLHGVSPYPAKAQEVDSGELPYAEDLFGPAEPTNWLEQAHVAMQRSIIRIQNAFGIQARAGFGEEPVATPSTALSPETLQAMKDLGMANDYAKGQTSFDKAVYEAIARSASAALLLGERTLSAAAGGVLGAGGQFLEELGLTQEGKGAADVQGVLTDPGVLVFTGGLGGVGGELEAAANARRLENLRVNASKWRAAGVTAEGEAGFYDAVPLTPENAQARVDAANEAGVPVPTPRPPPADVHELARRIEPDAFRQFDALEVEKQQAAQRLEALGSEQQISSAPEAEALRLSDDKVMGTTSFTYPISREGREVGAIVGDVKPDNVFRISTAGIADEAEMGKGAGLAAYRGLADEVLARGGVVHSDGELSAPAIRMYEKLKAEGYAVEQNPAAVQENGKLVAPSRGQWVFRVTEAPPEKIEMAEARQAMEAATQKQNTLLPEVNSAYAQAREMLPETPATVKAEELVEATKPVGEAETVAPKAPELAPGAGAVQAPSDVPRVSLRVSSDLRPIEGTGETKTLTLAQGVEAKAIENKMAEIFGDLPEYRVGEHAPQFQVVAEIIASDYNRAKEIAMGDRLPPEGVHPEAFFVGVENHAIAIGDNETLRRLATESKLPRAVNTMGQRLRLLGERDPTSPVGAIQNVEKARTATAAKRAPEGKDIAQAKSEVESEIRSEITAAHSTKDTWTAYIDGLRCKE